MNKLDEILIRFSKVNDVIRTKREIIEFFKGCVPTERETGEEYFTKINISFNQCREKMLNNIEKLK